MLLIPVAVYYLLKALKNELPNRAAYCAMVMIPLLLSLSFGVILGMTLSFLLLLVFRGGMKGVVWRALGWVVAALVVLVAAAALFPDNVVIRRVANILAGRDSSFRGRTFDSFVLSLDIVRKKSLFWGTGFGQFKLLGLDRFREYYNSNRYTMHDVVIP